MLLQPRNESKLHEAEKTLKIATDELMILLDVWERARPNLLKVEFETLRSVQKKYFSSTANILSDFIITSPGEPGGGVTVQQIADASGIEPIDLKPKKNTGLENLNAAQAFTGLPDSKEDGFQSSNILGNKVRV